MKNKNFRKIFIIILLLAGIAVTSFGFMGGDINGNKRPQPVYKLNSVLGSGKQGDAYRMNINNINLPFNRKGNIANVNIPPEKQGAGGRFAGPVFLFSAGFFLSGNANGQPWANAVAPSTLVEDYVPGTVAGGQGDPNAVIYVLNSQDEPFGPSWQDWIDAVGLGADFYDGDGDGVYNPVDKNDNGQWDPDEDRPDLIGDETAWCIFSDGLVSNQRRWNTVSQLGIEVKQTIFAFASAGAIGNLVFLRYRFKYVGGSDFLYGNPDELTDVYFGVWADPDLGQYDDDRVGSDVPRNAGYTYNGEATDGQYGNEPPCYMIDFFSGPVDYIPGETFIDNDGDGKYTDGVDTPLDTAFSVQGQIIGVKEFPGAKNLPISSFVEYLNGDPNLNDPSNKEEARNYMLGLDRVGEQVDPCEFSHGNPGFDGCETTDPLFWFSGDPVTGTGWISSDKQDVRQMTNTGPFNLERGVEKEIVVAYVVGQGSDWLNSITVARKIDDGAQNIFALNFLAPSPPPPVSPVLTSSDNFIDIVWETADAVSYLNKTPTWDLKFHIFNVYAFRTNNTVDIVSSTQNSLLIASYQVDNFIKSLYKENSETGGIEILYPEADSSNKLNLETYSDPETGRIRLRIYNDPFDNTTPITKGTPYYFAVVGSAINYDALVNKSDPADTLHTPGDYYLSSAAFAQEAENPRKIVSIVAGSDLYNPPVEVQPANQISGAGTGNVGYDVIDNEQLKNASYEVTFFKDSSSAEYKMFWQLENVSSSTVLVDTGDAYTYGLENVNQVVTEGFITKIEEQTATIGTPTYDPGEAIWYAPFDSASSTGAFYVGTDIPQGQTILKFPKNQSDYISADRLRRVELRFDGGGKAYRYINAYIGLPRGNSYAYASAITAADTVGKGVIGNWNADLDRANGFVDVPFTAWVVDDRYGEEQQLAVGFVERRRTETYPNADPDGIWDPTDSLILSGEIIVIFDAPYDPSGGQIEYTGGTFNTPGGEQTVWADMLKALVINNSIPDDAEGVTDQQRAIFDSPWFNTMYVVGLQRKDSSSFFTPGDKLIIPLDVYPYTDADVYQFTTSSRTITEAAEKELFDKVNVFPNPLYGFNTLTGYDGTAPDEPFVTFTNLPTDITVKVYSLSGQLLRTLSTADKSSPDSPFLRWDLQNENGLRVASGLYIAIISSKKFGDKILKFTIIMPQKQIPRF